MFLCGLHHRPSQLPLAYPMGCASLRVSLSPQSVISSTSRKSALPVRPLQRCPGLSEGSVERPHNRSPSQSPSFSLSVEQKRANPGKEAFDAIVRPFGAGRRFPELYRPVPVWGGGSRKPGRRDEFRTKTGRRRRRRDLLPESQPSRRQRPQPTGSSLRGRPATTPAHAETPLHGGPEGPGGGGGGRPGAPAVALADHRLPVEAGPGREAPEEAPRQRQPIAGQLSDGPRSGVGSLVSQPRLSSLPDDLGSGLSSANRGSALCRTFSGQVSCRVRSLAKDMVM